MNEKEFILPDGWEVKEVVDNKIILKEKETEFPRTWEECSISAISSNNLDDMIIKLRENEYKVISKGLGKSLFALCKLIICRNAWWEKLEWRPDWKNMIQDKFGIGFIKEQVTTFENECVSRILVFPTSEVRDQFLNSFRDLIEEAKELL